MKDEDEDEEVVVEVTAPGLGNVLTSCPKNLPIASFAKLRQRACE